MASKSKFAFGALEKVDEALSAGKIDSYDLLLLKDVNGKPYVGWVDKDGKKVICDNQTDLSDVEAELATKANVEDVEALENQIATKVDSDEVDAKVASANAYTDKRVESALAEHLTQKYEIADTPAGTLVKMNENEIRIMCPHDAEYHLQSVGVGGDANTYYMTLRTYVYDDSVVGYKEHLGKEVDAEILTDLKTDTYGRRYQPTWLGIAKYDEATNTWAYYGANSETNHYIGWDYQIDWFDANGVMIASDSVRINLSNEECHSVNEPYYVGDIMKEVDTKIAEATAGAIEVIEF